MARPRVFVSSTYYDLRHVRQVLESFIHSIGYDAVLFESGNIPFSHDRPLDISCYEEVENSHILVLIVGGRYGSPSSGAESQGKRDTANTASIEQFNSITKQEFLTAIDNDIPCYIFVDKSVLAEYSTFKANRDNTSVVYSHVDSPLIFHLLDEIYKLRQNNLVRGFDHVDEIVDWLRDQWAGLFANFIRRSGDEAKLKNLTTQVATLTNITESMKEFSQKIFASSVEPEIYKRISEEVKSKFNEKQARNILSNHPLGSHLCDHHKLDPLKILEAAKTSDTASDFATTVIGLTTKGCKAVGEADFAVTLFNALRQMLDLPLDPENQKITTYHRVHQPPQEIQDWGGVDPEVMRQIRAKIKTLHKKDSTKCDDENPT